MSMSMCIQSITLHRIRLELKSPFVTSHGSYSVRETMIIEMKDENQATGWGECVAFTTPWYTEETVDTAWTLMEQLLIPIILKQALKHPSDVQSLFQPIRRHHMAKAGLEMACWDLYCKQQGISLYQAMGGVRDEIPTGVAIGLQSSEKELYHLIEQYIEEGYQRIKVKIKPGQDIELIEGIRRVFPNIPLMADANSAYTLSDIDHLRALDAFELMMIEQPLGADDIIDHAKLQRQLKTPICLDESIIHYDNARHAIELGSCGIINIKMGRVGGWNEALRIHNLCALHHVQLWCGGMLESGIGRAHHAALATLSQFVFPGDLSASSRYWHRDIIHPEIQMENGRIRLSDRPGIGYDVDQEYMSSLTIRKQSFYR